MVHTFNPRTQETEAGVILWVLDQPGLQSEFQDTPKLQEKPCLQKRKHKTRQCYLVWVETDVPCALAKESHGSDCGIQ